MFFPKSSGSRAAVDYAAPVQIELNLPLRFGCKAFVCAFDCQDCGWSTSAMGGRQVRITMSSFASGCYCFSNSALRFISEPALRTPALSH